MPKAPASQASRRRKRLADAAAVGPATTAVASSAAGMDAAEGVDASSLAHLLRVLEIVVLTSVAWLYVCCGLSRSATSKLLKVLGGMLTLATQVGATLAGASPAVVDRCQTVVQFPRDARTVLSALSIEPVIHRSICCPKCHTAYPFGVDLPETCPNRETPRAHCCKEPLTTTRSTSLGPKCIPRMLYSTQSLSSWLTWFLSRPGIEALIAESYSHTVLPDGIMRSVWDSPAWQSIPPFATTTGHLTFALYIDWFNPFTNKLAGRVASCGLIMAVCLNLPPELATKVENTFFIGITPGPKEPNVVTLSELLKPVIDQFLAADEPHIPLRSKRPIFALPSSYVDSRSCYTIRRAPCAPHKSQ